MTLKKYLRNRGQASLEYFILFAFIAVLTIISFSSVFPNVKNSIFGDGGLFYKAVERIKK